MAHPAAEPESKPVLLSVGERDAILLAQQAGADVLIIDERAGCREAHNRGILVTDNAALE